MKIASLLTDLAESGVVHVRLAFFFLAHPTFRSRYSYCIPLSLEYDAVARTSQGYHPQPRLAAAAIIVTVPSEK